MLHTSIMGKSSRSILAIIRVGAPLLYLHMLVFHLTLPCGFRVGANTLAFDGFNEDSLWAVSNSSWILNNTTGCYKFDPKVLRRGVAASGRLLYPLPVQMIDPGSTNVISWSTTFIFQFQVVPEYGYNKGPGLVFCMVPDNLTLGAPGDSMGLITVETSKTAKNYESDNHTLGVELDISMNRDFNDTNDNHIGINLASMTSVYFVKPVYPLASGSAILFLQIWIVYSSADSRMDIYYARYKEGKPAKPQGSKSGLDLSLLKENMYIGFSSASLIGSGTVPYVCAWSFSNDGIPAPPIVIAPDATPSAPPPPPNGPAAAPSLPPPASLQSPPSVPTRSPISSPSPPPASNPPPLRAPNPSLVNPSSPPPLSVPSQVPSSKPPTIAKIGGKKKNLARVYVGVPLGSVIGGLGVFIFCCWIRFRSHPLHTFVCNAGGKDGSEKNFPKQLVPRLRKYFKWSNFTIFLDTVNIRYGEIIPRRIFEELARCDVGLVVVTMAFFKSKWAMTELITLIDRFENDNTRKNLQLLPLFYELTPDDVKDHLERKNWETEWETWRTRSLPLDVERCKQAVRWLCNNPRGVVYYYSKRDHDDKYIEEICTVLGGILREERSFSTYLRGRFVAFHVPSDCSLRGRKL